MTGERDKIEKWIEGADFVVRVEVEAFMPGEWPWKPQFGAEAVKLLERVRELAERGEVGELKKVGEVYVLQTA